jgi:alkanesulfonate monooxygenase SsuD/methylene tetrahydromethanopterin reductase-like flavin-dependent oxidoreductase (luciferase family)
MPSLSARVRVALDEPAHSSSARSYAMRGTPDEVAAEVRAFADLDIEHLALFFEADSPEVLVKAAERFAAEVAPLV